MVTYILLMKLTDRGIREISQAPKRIEEATTLFKEMGGEVIVFFPVMGEYDYVAVGDVPDDKTAIKFVLQLGARGFVRNTLLKAIPMDLFTRFVEQIKIEGQTDRGIEPT